MENIYPDDSHRKVSYSIKLKEHFAQYRQLLSETLFKNLQALETTDASMQAKISFAMNLDEEEYQDLDQRCRLNINLFIIHI